MRRTAITCLIVTSVLVSLPVVSRSAEPAIHLLEFNACGAGFGDCGSQPGGNTTTRVQAIRDEIVARSVDVVLLNELCNDQWVALKALLPSYESVWVTQDPGVPACGNDTRFGNVVMAKDLDASTRITYDLAPSPDPQDSRAFKLLCAQAMVRSISTKTCTAHLINNIPGYANQSASTRATQMEQIADWANGWAVTMPVIVGGDFNIEPTELVMDAVYAPPSGLGRFREVDDTDSCPMPCQGGAPTWRGSNGTTKKLDYIFASANHFSAPSAAVVDTAHSDHHYLRGSIL